MDTVASMYLEFALNFAIGLENILINIGDIFGLKAIFYYQWFFTALTLLGITLRYFLKKPSFKRIKRGLILSFVAIAILYLGKHIIGLFGELLVIFFKPTDFIKTITDYTFLSNGDYTFGIGFTGTIALLFSVVYECVFTIVSCFSLIILAYYPLVYTLCILSGYEFDGLKEYSELALKFIILPIWIECVMFVIRMEIIGIDQLVNLPILKGTILLMIIVFNSLFCYKSFFLISPSNKRVGSKVFGKNALLGKKAMGMSSNMIDLTPSKIKK